MAAAIVLACGSMTLVRTDGIMGETGSLMAWRWTPTAEERLLARAEDEPMAPVPAQTVEPPAYATSAPEVTTAAPAETPSTPTAEAADPPAAKERAEWPGFRGPDRNSVIRGVRIDTDWAASPPVEIWRRAIGPGWSSFAVRGDLLYTQEQRGDDEIVACYKVSTGQPVWMHRDAARFWESNGGAGPRGTPTLSNGRVYAFGATGILNALDAATGKAVWSRNVGTDASVEVPGWGFASSPLVIDDLVVVAAEGRLAAYDIATGQPRWLGPEGGAGYSSPHLMTIAGVPQIMLQRGSRTISVAPADGALLWEHLWQPGADIIQPAALANGEVLITTADAMGGQGMRRLTVAREPVGWTVKERWTSRNLKPYFNDFVVHNGHAFGFDGSILAAINLEDGARAWKGGRYGHGQLLLLPDQDLLLVSSEEGELALVRAIPDQFTEIARFKAIEGKTWNHPVLAGDVLLVRNGEEMAAFRLSLAAR
jgi:outer membrane protein assembly factor BamB